MSDDPIPAALRLASLFERLELEYWLGGSLASSIHGEPQSTHDVDFVLALGADDVEKLSAELEAEYLVDEQLIRDAVARGAAFQLVQKQGFHRVDVFVRGDDPFAREQLRRRVRAVIDPDANAAL